MNLDILMRLITITQYQTHTKEIGKITGSTVKVSRCWP